MQKRQNQKLHSDNHFSVDGSLIEIWASMKSFRPKDEPEDDQDSNNFQPCNPDVEFHGQKRSHNTHQSRTDPEANRYRKGPRKPLQLVHTGHVLSENRNILILEVRVSETNGTAEKDAALEILERYQPKHGHSPQTVNAGAGNNAGPFSIAFEDRRIELHVAMTKTEPANPDSVRAERKANILARRGMKGRQNSSRYRISQKIRKTIDECFCW